MITVKNISLSLVQIIAFTLLLSLTSNGVKAQFQPNTSLSKVNASFIGEDIEAEFGISVASAGDVNGDGFEDFLFGASLNDKGGENAGQTYLFLGRAAGDWGLDLSLSQADASFIGEVIDDRSGFSVASAGDVNGDGFDDFLIGAYSNDDGGTNAGQTYLFLGRAAADWGMDLSLSQANASFIGEAAFDLSGFFVTFAGDINGDGFGDFLIGAPYNDEGGGSAGQTYLFLGKATADWGMDLSLSQADASFIGEAGDDASGMSIASAGDVDGDGFGDFLIGANGNDEGGLNAGQTYLFLGRAAADWGMDLILSNADASFIGEAIDDRSGSSISSAGDVNNDGFGDFLIGAHDNDESGLNAGQTYLFLGKATADWGMDLNLSQADASFIGENAFDRSGSSISSAGDVNNDGFGDFLIGASGNDEGGKDAGQSYLILGRPKILREITVSPPYVTLGIDTIIISAALFDTTGIILSAEFEAPDEISLDTLRLLDDGAHHDGGAADGVFANSWLVRFFEERLYFIDLIGAIGSVSFDLNNVALFTTIGPLVFDSFIPLVDTIPNPGDRIFFKVALQNDGLTAPATEITADISTNNTCVTDISVSGQNTYGDINAGQIRATTGAYMVDISESCEGGSVIHFDLSIASNGIYFWEDSFMIDIVIGISDEEESLPKSYSLLQNHPNPFNPITVIEYALPEVSDVSLIIYDLGGKQIVNLIDGEHRAGKYQVIWDASGLASGIYFYRLQASGFAQTKKLILLK